MLSRLVPKPIHFRRLFSLPQKPYLSNSPINPKFTTIPKFFSTNNNNGNNTKDPFSPNVWKDFRDSEEKFDAFFADDNGETLAAVKEQQLWLEEKGGLDNEDEDAIFNGIDKESEEKNNVGGNIGIGAEYITPWSMKDEEDKGVDVFNFEEGDDVKEVNDGFNAGDAEESGRKEEIDKLEKEEKELTAVLKGPTRAFGDLITSSGITDEMLDSLIALKDFDGVEGLPPLSVIEDLRYDNNTRKSSRGEMERLKQEEAAKARVRQVDEKGRAYGTGRRKCSVARVWVQPGDGKFRVNDKEFDVYFPMLEHRATLLRPFSETKTLGLWDVNCTVKGGGVSGQVGAIRLGISKAMQSWEPDLRPALRNAGFLTRDARVVERKKPGKAKARKSYQWVKR
ncbi:PREDICTED: 28S ribosomal protein S9, mitochondrial-like isoform X2 [Lupinus angustifolius]|uniref:28S ribosomal protein S9, mitochondrial-like isoform X2 n=1 Tax=Lupinus angustifolius TaxID=3871 RepID=UPI00092F4F73|nr:PREDICTED: 28S ribosomal protein S9, mitochondrial-like isoform X2 [Lupinus angustifolius]